MSIASTRCGALVGGYRKRRIEPDEDPAFGCIFIRDTTFFRDGESVRPPVDLRPNVVQGRGYDLADPAHVDYFGELLGRLLGVGPAVDLDEPWRGLGPTYGDRRLTPQRLGQQAFQAVGCSGPATSVVRSLSRSSTSDSR